MDAQGIINFWTANGKMITIFFSMIGGTVIGWWALRSRVYIKASLASIQRSFSGKKKIAVVGNDGKIRSHSANFLNDYYMDEASDKSKMYALEPRGFYIDEFGEKVWYYNQDGTEQIHFHDQKKEFWVDKATGKPLLDKNGHYVTKLSLVEIWQDKYLKIANEQMKKQDDMIGMGLIDEFTGKKTILPAIIGGNSINGTDSTTTADIINRHLEMETIGFLKKYWKHIVIGAVVIMLMGAVAAYFGYKNQTDLKDAQVSLELIKQTLYNMTNPTVVS